MSLATLKALTEEKIVPLSKVTSSPRRYLKGIVRVVDKGVTLGLFMDAQSADDLLEDIEATSPTFSAKIKRSRKSGRVSLAAIEKDILQDGVNK